MARGSFTCAGRASCMNSRWRASGRPPIRGRISRPRRAGGCRPSLSRLAGDGEPQAEDDKQQTDAHEPHGGSPFAASSAPDAGDPPAAEGAASVLDVHLRDEEARASDHRLPAGRAVGVVPRVVRDVAHVGVAHPPAHRRSPAPAPASRPAWGGGSGAGSRGGSG